MIRVSAAIDSLPYIIVPLPVEKYQRGARVLARRLHGFVSRSSRSLCALRHRLVGETMLPNFAVRPHHRKGGVGCDRYLATILRLTPRTFGMGHAMTFPLSCLKEVS